MRDDIDKDPVVTAMLGRDGLTVNEIDWRVTSIWKEDGHEVMSAHHAGMDLKLHRDEEADWFATIHWGEHLTYHAQRGRRSLTIRRNIPESVLTNLTGMSASTVADMPGLDRMVIQQIRSSPGAPTSMVIEPLMEGMLLKDKGPSS